MIAVKGSWWRGGIGTLLALVCLRSIGVVALPDVLPVAMFSEMNPVEGLPAEWEFNPLASAYDETQFDLVRSDRGVVLRARSDAAGASIAVFQSIDPTKYPILEWHWKVNSIVEAGKADMKASSDLPARLYVTFDRERSLQNQLKALAFRAMGFKSVGTRAIVYVWANRVEKGRVFADPYVGWHWLLPVESGTTHVGTWRTERRNVRTDYRRIFGEAPPPIRSIGILTDTEQTGGTVTAYYGDIVVRKTMPDSGAVGTSP